MDAVTISCVGRRRIVVTTEGSECRLEILLGRRHLATLVLTHEEAVKLTRALAAATQACAEALET